MASDKSIEIYKILERKGFPLEFCREVAYVYMNTDYTANRMLGYLYAMPNLSLELIVDEMFAIITDRDRMVRKHEAEQAQAAINDLYNKGL